MRSWGKVIALLVLIALLACRRSGPSEDPPRSARRTQAAPYPAKKSKQAREVLAWVVPYGPSLVSLEKNLDAIHIVSPAYFRLRVDDMRTSLEDWDPGIAFPRATLEKIMNGRKQPVVPLVGCLDACAEKLTPILDDDRARAAHVAMLLDAVRTQKLGGLFIDYEEIHCRPGSFTRFTEDLSAGLHKDGKKLGIVVTEPCGPGPGCNRSGYAFELGPIARSAEWLAVMEYDFDVEANAPIAPRPWVQLGLEHVRTTVPEMLHYKVLVGAALYGRVTRGLLPDTALLWTDTQSTNVQGVPFRIVDKRFDPKAIAQVARVEATAAKKPGIAYFEDHETVASRLDLLVDANGLNGVAFWRLGGEDPCVWDVVRAWSRRAEKLDVICTPAAPP